MPSILDLTSQKKTYATTFRGDIRTLATLAMFFRDNEEPLRSLSDILALAVESLKHLVITTNPEYEILEYHDAVQFLERIGIFNLKKNFRNKPSLLQELSLEDLKLGGGNPGAVLKKKTKNKAGPFDSSQQQQEIFRTLEEQTIPVQHTTPETIEKAQKRREEEENETLTKLGEIPKEFLKSESEV